MSELQERFQRWADELVDLTARNELINFKVTKTSTILPDPKGLSKLLNGDTVAISDLCDLTDPDQIKPAKGAIKTAIEFKELPPIEETWDKFKAKCKEPIRRGDQKLWTNIVTAMRDASIGEVTKSNPLTADTRTLTDILRCPPRAQSGTAIAVPRTHRHH